jgi:TonB family protein
MRLKIIIERMVIGVSLLLAMQCGKKMAPPTVFIIGNDTLSIEQLRTLDPVGANDSIKIRNTGMRLLWVEGLAHINKGDTLVSLFSERLLLKSGIEWDRSAAALLLTAAQRIAAINDSVAFCTIVGHKADSICQKLGASISKPFMVKCGGIAWCDQGNQNGQASAQTFRTLCVSMLQRLFGISNEVAVLCYEFVGTSVSAPSNVLPKELISGLVASLDSTVASDTEKVSVSQNKLQKTTTEKRATATTALRFRDEKSIRDSIERHIPDIRQMYKKFLKTDADMAGKVVVTIRVDANGSVSNVTLKTSTIHNRTFLDPFQNYIKTIRFKPVPEKAGVLTFDFPFEFNPEM